jgi:hypothetical protein
MTTKRKRAPKGPELTCRWSKRDRDHVYDFDPGIASPSARLLDMALFRVHVLDGRTLAEELAARGFDLTTLRVSVRKPPRDDGDAGAEGSLSDTARPVSDRGGEDVR